MKFLVCLGVALLGVQSAAAQQKDETSQGLLAAGTEWETPYYITDSGVEGPTFFLTGGMHGNEPAGVAAAEQIRHWPIVRGKMIVVPAVNRKALEARERRFPGFEKGIADLNRNFPKTGESDEAKTVLGKALWAFAKESKPDWVIDLHEGFAINRQNPKSVGSSILCRPDDEVRPIFEHALATVNASIDDPLAQFKLKDDTFTADGSFVRASMQRLGAVGSIFETTYQGVPFGVRIRQHRLMVHRVLRDLKMIGDHGPDEFAMESGKIRVAIFIGPGVGVSGPTGSVGGNGPVALGAELAKSPDRFVTRIIGPAEVANGALARQFDVVIFPGGSGSKQAAGIGERGREAVREFISEGGGYVGICAGCYLACENFSWSLGILDAKTKSSKWKRGRKTLELSLAGEAGTEFFPTDRSAIEVLYVNGPVMAAANSPEIPDFETIALFKTEVAENGSPEGIQIGSPAIMRGKFGKGRVVGISPHPEQTPGLKSGVIRLIEWAAARPRSGP